MKGTTAALFFGILIIAIGVAWVFVGGPAQAADELQSVVPTPKPTAVPTTIPTTIISTTRPVTTIATPATAQTPATIPATVPATVVTTAVPQPEKPVSADQARDHFLDIAYSSNNKLERMNYTVSQDRLIISLVSPDDSDVTFLSGTAKEFNYASKTVKISENIKESTNGDIVFRFVPESGLSAISESKGIMYGGKEVALCGSTGGYISSNLKGDARNHTIARCFYYGLGVTGETTEYPDSVFYAEDNTNYRLSPVDKKAIAILYEPGLYYGMNMEELKKVIYFP